MAGGLLAIAAAPLVWFLGALAAGVRLVVPTMEGVLLEVGALSIAMGVAIVAGAGIRRMRSDRGVLTWSRIRRAVAAGAALVAGVTVYSVIKLNVPTLHPGSFDGPLAAADRWLCLGVNPNVFLLTILEGNHPWVGYLLDAEYGAFSLLTLAGLAWWTTHPSSRAAWRTVGAFVALWFAGELGYLLLPAVGPALGDLELWLEVRQVLPNAAGMEQLLLANLRGVHQVLAGGVAPVHLGFGVAAMPSLHVASHVYLAAVARSKAGRWTWWVLAGLTSVGAVASGWHYLVDVIVGAVLAASYSMFARAGRYSSSQRISASDRSRSQIGRSRSREHSSGVAGPAGTNRPLASDHRNLIGSFHRTVSTPRWSSLTTTNSVTFRA